ncbi:MULTISPECIES: hypothetical protein [Nocardiaceae]|uniref:hypothetical protein n=1 Tax=Nocardiaceae TaxID=85025 RepID=UPI00113FF520|nr:MULTISPECIES: hypothetical protein [Rhodococcus]
MTRDPRRRPRPSRRTPDTDTAAAAEITVAAGVKATVWPRTGTEGGEPTPLACGMFVDDADAYEFLRQQMFTLPARGVDQVVVRLAGAAGTAAPHRELVGTAASVLAPSTSTPRGRP